MDAEGELLGLEAELIRRFLTLFRDNYREVDLATLFLEQSKGISNAQGFLNVRDAISQSIREHGPGILDRIAFKGCNQTIQKIIEVVVAYMQEA